MSASLTELKFNASVTVAWYCFSVFLSSFLLLANPCSISNIELKALRWSNTNNKLLQLAMQQCCVVSWKVCCCTYYHAPPTLTSNKMWLFQVKAACCRKLNRRLLFSTKFFQLETTTFWLCDNVWGGWQYVQQRFSTCNATMLHCKLKKNVARITGL